MKFVYVALFFFMCVTSASAQCGIASEYETKGNNITAAHPNLPFGTRVHVINQHNHRSVVVKINDRGPFIKGRIIDLSLAAARAIGWMVLATFVYKQYK
jgi:rare lipoprotein A